MPHFVRVMPDHSTRSADVSDDSLRKVIEVLTDAPADEVDPSTVTATLEGAIGEDSPGSVTLDDRLVHAIHWALKRMTNDPALPDDLHGLRFVVDP
jgi:hypothetical protein